MHRSVGSPGVGGRLWLRGYWQGSTRRIFSLLPALPGAA
jgi:hypothetical protein